MSLVNSFYTRSNHRAFHQQKTNTRQMHARTLQLPKVKAIIARGGRVPNDLQGVLTSLSTFYSDVNFFYWSKGNDGRLLLIGENIKPSFGQEKLVRVTLVNQRDIHIAEKALGFSSESLDVTHGKLSNDRNRIMVVCGYAIDNRDIKGKLYSVMPVITRIAVVTEKNDVS